VEKVYVNGVDVSVLISREIYFDHSGKPITTSLKDYTKEIITGKYTSINEFLQKVFCKKSTVYERKRI
jgi:type I restriction enzyme R subunit